MRQPPAARILLVVALLLFLPLLAGPAEASHTRVLVQGHVEGSGWVAVTLLLRDGSVSLRARGAIFSDHHAEGIVQLDEDEQPLSAQVRWSAPTAHVSVRQGFPLLSTRPPSSVDTIGTESAVEAGATFSGSGVRTFVLWMAGDYSVWSYQVVVTSGVALLGVSTGRDAFLHEARDFDGPLHARAAVQSVGVRASVDTSLTLDVEHHLVGLFHASSNPIESAYVEAPGERREDCPCWFFGPGDERAGPGRYVFHLDGARMSRTGDVVVTGADVSLPEY